MPEKCKNCDGLGFHSLEPMRPWRGFMPCYTCNRFTNCSSVYAYTLACCLVHDDLVAALEATKELLDVLHQADGNFTELEEQIDAALAKAKPETDDA